MSKKILLDTPALICYQGDNPELPQIVINEIRDTNNTVFFSQINLFEITIKQKIGKLPLFKASIETIYENAISDGFAFLSIQNEHIYNYEKVIITSDKNFKLYGDIVKIF